MKLINEFKDFINEYKIFGVAIAVVIAGAITGLINSGVDSIIMPLINKSRIVTSNVVLDSITSNYNSLLVKLVNFIVIISLVLIVCKIIMRKRRKSE